MLPVTGLFSSPRSHKGHLLQYLMNGPCLPRKQPSSAFGELLLLVHPCNSGNAGCSNILYVARGTGCWGCSISVLTWGLCALSTCPLMQAPDQYPCTMHSCAICILCWWPALQLHLTCRLRKHSSNALSLALMCISSYCPLSLFALFKFLIVASQWDARDGYHTWWISWVQSELQFTVAAGCNSGGWVPCMWLSVTQQHNWVEV